MFHGRKGLRLTGRWILLAAMALLLSGVGLLVVPGAGADKITDGSSCGASKDAVVHSDTTTPASDCCASGDSQVRGDEIKTGGDESGSGDTSSCGDTDGSGNGNDGDSDDSGSGCASDSSVVHSDTTTVGGNSSDCDEVGGVDNDNDGDDVGGTTGPTGPTGPSGPSGPTGPTGTTTTTTSGVTTTAPSGVQQIKGASSSKGKAKACTSRRLFVIHVRHPHGQYLVAATVTVNGKRVSTMKGHRISSTIRLVGLPKGTVKVHIRAVTNTGKVLRGVRTYHTCVAGRHGSVPKL
jgi:hypothetical protein